MTQPVIIIGGCSSNNGLSGYSAKLQSNTNKLFVDAELTPPAYLELTWTEIFTDSASLDPDDLVLGTINIETYETDAPTATAVQDEIIARMDAITAADERPLFIAHSTASIVMADIAIRQDAEAEPDLAWNGTITMASVLGYVTPAYTASGAFLDRLVPIQAIDTDWLGVWCDLFSWGDFLGTGRLFGYPLIASGAGLEAAGYPATSLAIETGENLLMGHTTFFWRSKEAAQALFDMLTA